MSPHKAFDGAKYIDLQSTEIRKRLDDFPNGKLYFEIGGKFLKDEHAARVLPGFDPESKIKILKSFTQDFDLIFCISSPDLPADRVWEADKTYQESVIDMLVEIERAGLPRPKIAINLYDGEPETDEFRADLESKGYKTHLRHKINDYPGNLDLVVSPNGYGRDEYVETDGSLVVVVGLGSNSGKMSTCMGQVYLDKMRGLDSGYAKYETFPIWNLPIDHPVNLAYEAATADIGDFNIYDHFHQKAYLVKSVNYNRDVNAFPILRRLIEKIVSEGNSMRKYKSPTDMGINMAKAGFVDEEAIKRAAIEEIKARIKRCRREVDKGLGKQEWVDRCEELLRKADVLGF